MPTTLFWFRRDLRLNDNAGLFHALRSGQDVQCVFIFDTEILSKLEDKSDARVTFLHDTLASMQQALLALGATLDVRYGQPKAIWPELLKEYQPEKVIANRDYEPYALERDAWVKNLAEQSNVVFETYKDHVIFEYLEVAKDDGKPYTVFTPYSRKWKAKLSSELATDGSGGSAFFQSYPSETHLVALRKAAPKAIPTLKEMGFERSSIEIPPATVTNSLIKQYAERRNFPAVAGTSRLGIHFRFGTISIREKARKAEQLSETFFNELIWRDFYSQILANFPHVVNGPFRPEYDKIAWSNDETLFKAWCEGRTGYALVDAGMRELNATGFMHNRVRMLVASFLSKHLLIDWRWGEAYFAKKLLDFDLASNNGGFQWAAGCGTDAAPYFRIFSPEAQLLKFDAKLEYVKRWVPEYGTSAYPKPIVDHAAARVKCLEVYKKGLEKSEE